jgi:two-component system NtrC family response regulator
MLQICRSIEKIAPSDLTVLLTGESGTGKEVLARALHKLSRRASKPFVPINCGAIPETLLESELFGYERGAFTGAVKQTLGKIEVAQHGTIFLDEIGDVPLPLQVKLLRFLQERVIERVGGRKEIPVDVRVVCATNHDLPEMVRSGKFREDLYYRLNEVTIRIPALREREGDPLVLAHHFLNQFKAQQTRAVRGFNPDARKLIANYAWPGNVRELQNRVRRAMLMTDRNLITVADLDLPEDAEAQSAKSWPLTLREARHSAEQHAVKAALAAADGNISEAARILGISRPTLYDLTRTYGLRAVIDQAAHNHDSRSDAPADADEHGLQQPTP